MKIRKNNSGIEKSHKKAVKKEKNLTIMLFSHSQEKPRQIYMPHRLIKLAMAGVAVIGLVSAYGIYSAVTLRDTMVQRARMRQRIAELEESHAAILNENGALKEDILEQANEIAALNDGIDKTKLEMAELYERENIIRRELGMEPVEVPQLETATSTDAALLLENSVRQRVDAYDGYISLAVSATYREEKRQEEAAALRQSVIDYARQFIGGRYVYGSNDPHTGVDCSGFTRYILGNVAGVYLSRTSSSQSTMGESVSIEEARPGDLIFYGNGTSSVNHVAIYVGNGRIVHASNERNGIIESNWNYRTPVAIKNVIGE